MEDLQLSSRSKRVLRRLDPISHSMDGRKLQHTFLGLGENIESLYLDNFYSALSGSEQQRIGVAGGASPYSNDAPS